MAFSHMFILFNVKYITHETEQINTNKNLK